MGSWMVASASWAPKPLWMTLYRSCVEYVVGGSPGFTLIVYVSGRSVLVVAAACLALALDWNSDNPQPVHVLTLMYCPQTQCQGMRDLRFFGRDPTPRRRWLHARVRGPRGVFSLGTRLAE